VPRRGSRATSAVSASVPRRFRARSPGVRDAVVDEKNANRDKIVVCHVWSGHGRHSWDVNVRNHFGRRASDAAHALPAGSLSERRRALGSSASRPLAPAARVGAEEPRNAPLGEAVSWRT
jgi:hypothetical protein